MIIYVSGKYSADTDEGISENIQKAREAAIAIWEMGHTALCPHLNTAHFERDCKSTYDDYIRGDIELLEMCDAILMLDGWEQSKGAMIELKHATSEYALFPLEVYYSLRDIPAPKNKVAEYNKLKGM